MSTYVERRVNILAERLRTRTQKDGRPLPGYEQNVAAIKAELAQLSVKEMDNGN